MKMEQIGEIGVDAGIIMENEKEILDSLCLPYFYMPVYMTIDGRAWGDDEQVKTKNSGFATECKQSFLHCVLKFHPLNQQSNKLLKLEVKENA